MLIQYAPIFITASSFFIATALHWVYKKTFILPCFLSAFASSVVAFVCFQFLPNTYLKTVSPDFVPWNVIGFAFSSGFLLALLVGYLMKYAPSLFRD